MKVLIIRNASTNDFGGAETYAYNLSRAFTDNGLAVMLLTQLQPLLDKCLKNGIIAKKGPWNQSQEWTRRYYARYPLTSLWYLWQIIIHRIDVVNPQGRDDFIFATMAGWLLKKPVVWTDHGDLKYILDRENHPNRRIQAWILSAAKKANAIVCVSESEKEEIRRVAPELDNLVVVHNGVFVPKGVAAVERPADSGVIVGTNARLVKAKGIVELLEGFAASKIAHSGSLWIVGSENHDREDYYEIAKNLGIADRVKFWGYVTNPNDYVAAMDIFVHASYHEAFSLAVIEAAMLGKAIVATAVGGTPEIIDAACGVLIRPKSSPDITQAIDVLADDPSLRKKLGEQARKKAIEQFNFDTIVSTQLIPLYLGEA